MFIKKPLFLLCISLVLLPANSFLQAGIDGTSGSTSMVETRGPENATLLVIGGAASSVFYEKFMDLVGGADAPIVVIPTAVTSDPLSADDLERFKSGFTNRGLKNLGAELRGIFDPNIILKVLAYPEVELRGMRERDSIM